jgi:hypothetical protein
MSLNGRPSFPKRFLTVTISCGHPASHHGSIAAARVPVPSEPPGPACFARPIFPRRQAFLLKALPRSVSNLVDLAAHSDPGAKSSDKEIAFDDVEVLQVINTLSRNANINLEIDPEVASRLDGTARRRGPVRMSLRVKGTTPAAALAGVLHDRNLGAFSTGAGKSVRISTMPVTLGHLLEWFEQAGETWNLLYEAAKRPGSRFEGDYSQPSFEPRPNFAVIRALSHSLATRSRMQLVLGRADAALQDALLIARLMDLFTPQSTTSLNVIVMMRVGLAGVLADLIGDGLADGLWNPSAIARFTDALRPLDLLSDLDHSLRGAERAALLHQIENIARDRANSAILLDPHGKWKSPEEFILAISPDGWIYRNAEMCSRLMEEYVKPVDARKHRVSPEDVDRSALRVHRALRHVTPYNFLVSWMMGNFSKSVKTTARSAGVVDQLRVAMALEQHRTATGQYPTRLSDLEPRFIERVPHDLLTGQPLKYRRTDDGRYLLYSVGWNQRDDGGRSTAEIAKSQPGHSDCDDLVWRYVPRHQELN